MDGSLINALFLQVLRLAESPLQSVYLAHLADMTRAEAEAALRALRGKGYAAMVPGGRWKNTADAPVIQNACRLLREEAPKDSIGWHLAFLEEDLWVDHIDHLLAFLDEQIRGGNPSIFACLQLTVHFFLRLGERLVRFSEPVQSKKFLETVILVQVLCFSNKKCIDEATRLSPMYYEINLASQSDGFPMYMDMVKKFTDFSLSKGSIAKELTQSLAPGVEGTLSPLQSNTYVATFKQLFDVMEKSSGPAETQLLNVVATGLSHIAMHMRNFSISEHISTSLLNLDQGARQNNDAISLTWLSHYCFVLIRQGKLDEALEYITLLFNCLDTTGDPLSFASAARALALYHFFLGRVEYAHTVLSRETRSGIERGIPHAPFLDPMNFDMLFVFEQYGYPPVPRYELTLTIEGVLKQGSQLMQGTALRIQALRLRAKGESPVEVIRLLKASKDKFHPERDVRELVLTLHELANTMTLAGAYDEARQYRQIVAAYAGRPIDPDTPYMQLAFIATCIRSEERAEERIAEGPDLADTGVVEIIPTPPGLDADVIIGEGMQAILKTATTAAASSAQILIQGETGVGKELVARHIHAQSGCGGHFVPIHPASTSETLFESEFFGHERGAFTGATAIRKGFFEEADNGTLFIDEAGDIPPLLQTKLLRVLQEKRFMRVGSNKLINSNFRLVTATNRDLRDDVDSGLFRADLLFRIAVIPIFIPPLRERAGDILPLADAYLAKFGRMYNKPAPLLSPEDRNALLHYSWPGNVRELRNAMERSVVQGCFSREFLRYEKQHTTHKQALPFFDGLPRLDELEKHYLRHVLHQTGGRVRGEDGAAALLHMKSSTLYAKLKRYGLS